MTIELDINILYQALTVALIILVTYIIGRITARFFREAFKKAGIPETETVFVASVVKYSIYLIGITIALGYMGIPVTSLWIALALGAVILGIAARSALDNIVSGYFLRTYGPFDVGDVIEVNGRKGMVKDLTPLKTVIETPEHLVYSIPNSKVMQLEIYNFTRYRSEYPVELEFETSPEADFEDVRLKILDIISSYPKVSYEKPIQIYVQRFTGEGTLLKVLFFVPSFELILGAKNFLASEILEKSKTGEIPILHSSRRLVQQDISRKLESIKPVSPSEKRRKEDEKITKSVEEPKCPTCDSRNWQGYLHCRTCGGNFIFGKCKDCDNLRLERCSIDGGELELIEPKET